LLLGGAGAPEHVGELLLLLAYESKATRQITSQVRSAVWVGQRRWNLVLANGVEIWLPEDDAAAALLQLAKLDTNHNLLGRDYGVVDLRLPDKLYLKKRTQVGDLSTGPV
jgi:cell division protein FtsQ